jgi:hypothetical protein
MIVSMRAFVFLLILTNLLFFVWTQGYFGSSASPDAIRLQQQLLAEQITIVSRGEAPVADKSAKVQKALESKAADSCLRWSDLSIADADRLERVIAEKFSGFKVLRTSVPGSSTSWVFIPPLANKPLADKKAVELKKLGAPEFFVVQEPGPNQLAISLGIFSSEEAANERLEALRAIGIKSAKVGERSVKPALASIEANGPGAEGEALREAAAALLPEIRSASCKAPA